MTVAVPLADRTLTYGPPGETLRAVGGRWSATSPLAAYERSVQLGKGEACWSAACQETLRWGVKLRSGFSVETETGARRRAQPVEEGERVWLVAGVGPLRVREPAQVVGVLDQADCKGFAYGTLTGHPVSGEEAFLVSRRTDGTVWLTLRSLSGPGQGRWRLAYPLVLVAQRFFRCRYLRALLA